MIRGCGKNGEVVNEVQKGAVCGCWVHLGVVQHGPCDHFSLSRVARSSLFTRLHHDDAEGQSLRRACKPSRSVTASRKGCETDCCHVLLKAAAELHMLGNSNCGYSIGEYQVCSIWP